MTVLTLEKLLQPCERIPTKVPTPEIEPGSCVYILGCGPDDRDLAEVQFTNYKRSIQSEGNVGIRKFLVTWCLCDPDNNRLVDPGPDETAVSPEFLDAMNALSESIPMATFVRVFDAAHKAMGMSQDDIEELEKNSETTTADDGNG